MGSTCSGIKSLFVPKRGGNIRRNVRLFFPNKFEKLTDLKNGRWGQYDPEYPVKYRLYMYFACENQIKKITDYSIQIRANGLIRELKPDSSGICLIPKSDSLYLLRVPILHYVSLAIDKTKELITDTITVPPIYMAPIPRNYIGPTYYQYYKCGKPCNGFEDAYRSDGQLWQKGYFKIGKLKSFKTYYVGGLLESKIKNRLINGCDVSFDKSGKLMQRFSYFLFISHYKIYDKANDKYISRFSFGRYK